MWQGIGWELFGNMEYDENILDLRNMELAVRDD